MKKDSPPKRIKVAVIDDHVDTVTSISNYLEAKGFKTVWAYDGKAAVELCKKENPDALVLDIKMPEMNGFEVAKALQGKQKIIFMTAYEDVQQEAAKFNNAIGIINKPVDLEEVLSLLRKAFHIPTPKLG
jgi:DNA-binding response OmpR family regulator